MMTPSQCRQHADHCRRMAASAPPALAHEFESLATTWMRLADNLEQAQLLQPAPRTVIPLRTQTLVQQHQQQKQEKEYEEGQLSAWPSSSQPL